jgi:D-alanine-D-alanine ligase
LGCGLIDHEASIPVPDKVGAMITSESGAATPRGPHERPRVLVLVGGRSSEHAISCVSGAAVLEVLERERWDVVVVGIGRDGAWHLLPDDPAPLRLADGVLPEVDATAPAAWLVPDANGARLSAAVDASGGDLGRIDVVFPLLHGPWGEDGTVQGLLETYGLAYVGSGVLASAVSMDKAAMKQTLAAHGVPIGPYEVVHDGEWRLGQQRVLARIEFALELPVFVKPARAGSSMGITRVTAWGDLAPAIEAARAHDPKVVIEQGIEGREIECGVLGTGRDDRARSSVCAEIVIRDGRAFYDFEAKYLDDAVDLVVPADLPATLSAQLRDLAVRSFEALSCEGLARVDFFVPDSGAPLVNEVNTMPGFTPTSMYPRMWAAAGVDYPTLVDALLELALTRSKGLR